MLNEKHDLVHEFPEHRDTITSLKTGNAHFSKLFDTYHKVDREIHRIESGLETPADDYVEKLKKQRLQLKDDLFTMIRNA